MTADIFLGWLNSLPAALLLAGLSWAALRGMKNADAAARHAAWWAVLAAVAALPFLPFARQAWPQSAQAPVPVLQQPRETHPWATQGAAAEPAATAMTVQVEPPKTAPLQLGEGRWLILVAAVWAFLSLFQLTRLALCYFALRDLKLSARPAPQALRIEAAEWALATGLHRDFRLLVSDDIETPVAVGFRHPAVILPAGLLRVLQSEDLDHVLLHEIAHLARRDDWSNLALRGIAGALALHPVAHWVIRQIDRERELACDDRVVAATGQARQYAVSLARLLELNAVQTAPLLASGMGVGGSEAGARIERLLRSDRSGGGRPTSVPLVLGGLLLIALLVAAGSLPPFAVWAREVRPQAEAAKPASATVQNEPAAKAGPKQAKSSQTPPAAGQSREPEGYLAMLHKAGYADLTVDEIIELKIHGVDGRFILEVNGAGFGRLTPRQLRELKIHGVSAAQAREAKRFKPNATVEQVIQMKIAGVL